MTDILNKVRNQPCTACNRQPPSDPHHVTTRGAGGKDTEDNLMPLCRRHHQEWHQIGPSEMIEKYPRIYTWLVIYNKLKSKWLSK